MDSGPGSALSAHKTDMGPNMSFADDVTRGYAADAKALIAQYDQVPSDTIYAPVRDLFPPAPARVLDVGTGNGRDAVWCAEMGHDVTAVDPVQAFVAETMKRVPAATIQKDRLPDLATVRGLYDLILVNGVWQHIPASERAASLVRLAALLADGGRMVLSLRHGPGHPGRPVLPVAVDVDVTVREAEAVGLHLLRQRDTGSLQQGNIAAGVRWTWLVFSRVTG